MMSTKRRKEIRKNIRKLVLFCTGAALLGTAGCWDFLPAGDPPPGDIVKNEPLSPAEETPRARQNRLTTALIVCALNHCPGSAWALECAPEEFALGQDLIRGVAETAGIHWVAAGTPGCYTLRAEKEQTQILWRLIAPDGKCIWQDR